MENNTKLKLLYILTYLSKNADKDHPAAIAEIIHFLSEKGISAERKSLYSDFECLREFGLNVETVKSKSVGYYIDNLLFEESDITLLWDIVSSYPLLSSQRVGEIRKKLESISNIYFRKKLKQRKYLISRTTSEGDVFYSNLDLIHKAIEKKCQISFEKTFIFPGEKAHKKKYVINPYIITYSQGAYILIAGCPKLEGLSEFRIDKMENAVLVSSPATDVREFVGDMDFDIVTYAQGLFGEYGTDSSHIHLLCTDTIIDSIKNTFGSEIEISRNADGMFDVVFDAEINEDLVSWLFLRSNDAKVIEPKDLIDALKNTAKDVYITYS